MKPNMAEAPWLQPLPAPNLPVVPFLRIQLVTAPAVALITIRVHPSSLTVLFQETPPTMPVAANWSGNLLASSTTFITNQDSGDYGGGGVFNYQASLLLPNAPSGNYADYGGGFYNLDGAPVFQSWYIYKQFRR